MTTHRHTWTLIYRDTFGQFDKQEGQNNTVYCRGRIEGCSVCPALRIVPHDPRLRTVEVERAA